MSPWTPLVGATLGWAASAVLTRAILVRGVSTWTLIPIRMVIALATLAAVMVITRRFWTTSPDAWRRGLVLGTVAMAFPMVFMTLAIEDLPVTLGSLLIALVPLSTIAAAHFLVDGERFQVRALPGLLLALAGSALLVGVGGTTVAGVGNLWRGVLFIMAGVVLAGVGGALSRRFALEMPSERLILPQFTVNTVVVVVLLPLLFPVDMTSVDGVSWLLIAGVGTVGTTLAFAAFLTAAGVNPASRLALTGYAIPVLAVVLAVIFLGETVTPAIAAGAVLIVAGVVIAERATQHVHQPGIATST
ncbi:MAG TPA: DMT family transporter [Acidimicrobiia bacterium]|nr:DMT family transporter [Acidimicrobiia bacterium]